MSRGGGVYLVSTKIKLVALPIHVDKSFKVTAQITVHMHCKIADKWRDLLLRGLVSDPSKGMKSMAI